MGAWGDGLLDHDETLDALSSWLTDHHWGEGLVDRLVGAAVLLELEPSVVELDPDRVRALLGPPTDWAGLPSDAQGLLRRFHRNPATFAAYPGERDDERRAVLGGCNDGHRMEDLYALPDAARALQRLAECAATDLDDLPDGDLYAVLGSAAPLVVLIQLSDRLRLPAARIARWRRTLDAADAATADEREFWDAWVARARTGLDLLAQIWA